MDSPVVVDTASELGRGIDLDRAFPGFPFDDEETFGRRNNDIRSHLDDLASRHPEFADHLLGSAWGDIPAFHGTGSLRNRRRRDSGGSSSHQGHQDEDARSQTSGSSGNSAASGASGVSSRGEPSKNLLYNEKPEPIFVKPVNSHGTRRNPLPHYGLRNTVDIGQHRHDMDSNERINDNRGQRSMSAPPENRGQNDLSSIPQEQQQENPQSTNQRYISRVDITPQFVQQPVQQPAHDEQQKVHQTQTSNVRHIPIFVEGRDEPIVPKNQDNETDGGTWSYGKQQRTASPTNFQQTPEFPLPPQFQRPSHFNRHYATSGRARDWLPTFEEEFYNPRGSAKQPDLRKHREPFDSHSPTRQGAFSRQSQNDKNDKTSRRQRNENSNHEQPSPSHGTHRQQQPEATCEPPRKQTQPKDPLDKVADVQKEIDSLNEQVTLWNGKSRKDKDYMYLDEMLTRELIKLDDIETEGKENVRQARRNAIKSIQDSISLLESKAPLNEHKAAKGTTEIPHDTTMITDSRDNTPREIVGDETNEINVKTVINEQPEILPIPLPAGTLSFTNETTILPAKLDDTIERTTADNEDNVTLRNSTSQDNIAMDVNPVMKVSSLGAMDIQAIPEILQDGSVGEARIVAPDASMMDVEHSNSPRATRRMHKTRKQQQQAPISDGAIPLPAPPENHQINVAK